MERAGQRGFITVEELGMMCIHPTWHADSQAHAQGPHDSFSGKHLQCQQDKVCKAPHM